MIKILNTHYGILKEQSFDSYLPEDNGYKTIIFFHGGGLNSGDKADTSLVEIAESFVKSGYAFISVNYRLYGYSDVKFPGYIEDCALAIKFIQDCIHEMGGNGELIIAGQSAGAYLVMMLCFDKHYLSDLGVNRDNIIGWIPESGQTTTHFYVQQMEDKINGNYQRIDFKAPIYYVNEDTEFSKMLLFAYLNDMPMRLEHNQLLYKTLKFFNPEANVSLLILDGTHCRGTCIKDEDGLYPFYKEVMKWLGE